jgi:hypothetical protein
MYSCVIKGVAMKLMINGFGPGTEMFVPGGFKMAKTYSPC